MSLLQERQKLVEFGKQLSREKLTVGTGGNLSIYNRDQGLMVITPSGIPYEKITLRDVVIMDLEGNVVEGDRKPSSEFPFHRIIYKNRPDLNAIIHTHSIYSNIMAVLGWDLPPVHYMLAIAGENVRCAPYRTFGTEELAEVAYEYMEGRKAVLLSNHGLITGGKDLQEAYQVAQEVEYVAELYYRSKTIGDPNILDHEEMEKVMRKFETYGQAKKEELI